MLVIVAQLKSCLSVVKSPVKSDFQFDLLAFFITEKWDKDLWRPSKDAPVAFKPLSKQAGLHDWLTAELEGTLKHNVLKLVMEIVVYKPGIHNILLPVVSKNKDNTT